MRPHSACYLSLMILFCSSFLGAQSTQSGLTPRVSTPSSPAYYYIAKPGELTIQVNVWGAIRNSGRYEVSGSTDLVQLISFAGGPIAEAELDNVRIVRSLKQGESERETYVVNLEELEDTDQSQLVLQSGDTIFVGRSNWTTVRDVMTVVTTVAAVATAISYIIIVQNR